MAGLVQTKYVKKNMTKEWLLANGFRYNTLFSNDESEVYTYRFPVYKYNKFTVLECEIKVELGDDTVNVNIYDYNTNDKYAPFYYCEYGDYDNMLKEIYKKVENVLNKLKIYGENSNDK